MAGKSPRGFGAMDQEKQRQIASKGGKAAHRKGTAHQFTPEEARAAGRKGGQAAHQRGTAHQFTPEEAAEAGRKGGKAAHHRNNNLGSNPVPAEAERQAIPMATARPEEQAPAPTMEAGMSGFPNGAPNGAQTGSHHETPQPVLRTE